MFFSSLKVLSIISFFFTVEELKSFWKGAPSKIVF